MSRALRKQVLTLVNLLEQAGKTLKVNLKAGNTKKEISYQLLSDCQETAIGIGNELERVYGEGTESVGKLEEYCEGLYQMTLALDEPEKSRQILKKLNIQIRQTATLIRDLIPDKLEVVFLPYKVSMWDSLESVWRAAEEDEECDAYVVPIPYYDRNQDGSYGAYHYEGEQMPDDVPVTHYKNYDLKSRRPDIIFIHNPYDGCNLVTGVAPEFYAAELRKYTDRLVYIPYFVLGEIDPNNRDAVKQIAHFCTLPGVLYADQVIVQSENVRQVYINVLTEAYGEKTRKGWEQKILGLGSPKYDKVQSISRDDLEVPEEWMKIIQNPNGNRKKIILYNTSIAAFLENQERMLLKIRSVFQAFRKIGQDVALLWRPHPLMEATINSMCSQVKDEYHKLVTEYRSEGWGIYDDTPELGRAIALCDAYYGDYSSLVLLCKKAGKPIMIQNVDAICVGGK